MNAAILLLVIVSTFVAVFIPWRFFQRDARRDEEREKRIYKEA